MSSIYAGKLRIRVAGLLLLEDKLVLVQINSPVSNTKIWIPPGGGVAFGESLHDALIREFKEETNIDVQIGELRHINELISNGFHALEFFFDVTYAGGKLILGSDPEHKPDEQLLSDIGTFSKENIQQLDVKPDFLINDYWQGITSQSLG